MSKRDLSSWIPKTEAANMLRISTRSLERMAESKRIETALRPEPGKRPALVVNPRDVERVAAELNAERDKPFVIPPGVVDMPAGTSSALVSTRGAGMVAQAPQSLPKLAPAYRLFLTLEEAKEIVGLPLSVLKGWVLEGKIHGVLSGRRWYIRRKDLDNL